MFAIALGRAAGKPILYVNHIIQCGTSKGAVRCNQGRHLGGLGGFMDPPKDCEV